jgi:hypothetical protein
MMEWIRDIEDEEYPMSFPVLPPFLYIFLFFYPPGRNQVLSRLGKLGPLLVPTNPCSTAPGVIECYVSLSGSANAKNYESLESVFPQGLVRLSREFCKGCASVGSSWPWYTGL